MPILKKSPPLINLSKTGLLVSNYGHCVQPSHTSIFGLINRPIFSLSSETHLVHPDSSANSRVGLDPETGEISEAVGYRLRRWRLQTVARRLLPESRLHVCFRYAIPERSPRIYRRECGDSHHAYFSGLLVCGLLWICPVCAAKIAERRRVELIGALRDHRAGGGGAYLMTLTVPHAINQPCRDVTDRLLDAYRRLGQGRVRWTSVVPDYIGSIRALEVTHGAHGWHSHLHVLVFTSQAVSELVGAQEILRDRWEHVTRLTGFTGLSREHGLTLQGGASAAEYVTKGNWGAAEELTRAHSKLGGRGGRTPFQLLSDTGDGDERAGELFQEFAEAFRGRRQLVWSRGLRDQLGLNREQSDEELATETVEAEDLLFIVLDALQMGLIRRNDLQGFVLELARQGDKTALISMFESLLSKTKECKGR